MMPPAVVSSSPRGHVPWKRHAGVLFLYLAIAAVFTWPLVRDMGARLGGDAGDPSLVASILWRNAWMLPFSPAWWDAPQYHPVNGVSAFTETFVGLWPIATPVAWLTGSPLLTYNVTLFLTWPLSAFTAYLLVAYLSGRRDAGILAGLAFGFGPYRADGLSHLHTLSSFWIPLTLLGMHAFVRERRARWLLLMGGSWLLQSLSNGHYMIFGAPLVALWVAYFCTVAGRWRAGAAIAGMWVAASLPLLPVMLTYRSIHERFGLTRSLNEVLAFSATPASWLSVSGDVWLWGKWLGRDVANLFPGVTALAIVGVAAAAACSRRPQSPGGRAPRGLRIALAFGVAVSAAAIAVSLYAGRWSAAIGGVTVFRMANINRALPLLVACGVALLWLSASVRAALRRRSPFVFYTAAALGIAVLCFGPVLRGAGEVILSPAPYGVLMGLPGFSSLRVPTRFWMLGTLCLAIAAGLGYAWLRPIPRRAAPVFAVVAIGLVADGWMGGMRMEAAPAAWTEVEPAGRTEPILELPLTNEFAATYRTAVHGRRVFNGVSGYYPPHYVALVDGITRRDPATLQALASQGSFDAVVDRAADPGGAYVAYVAGIPGALRIADDGVRVAYRIPQGAPERELGEVIPIAHVSASWYPEQAAFAHDRRLDTGWGGYPQKPGQQLVLDLGALREIAGLTHVMGDYQLAFPRTLAIDVSADGAAWERVWQGPTAAQTLLGYLRHPREGALRLPFPARTARFVRLEQLEAGMGMWRVSEATVHAPAR